MEGTPQASKRSSAGKEEESLSRPSGKRERVLLAFGEEDESFEQFSFILQTMVRTLLVLLILCITNGIAEESKKNDDLDETIESTHEEEIQVPVAGGAKVVVPVIGEEPTQQHEQAKPPKRHDPRKEFSKGEYGEESASQPTKDSVQPGDPAMLPPEVADALSELPVDESDWGMDELDSRVADPDEELDERFDAPDIFVASGVRKELVESVHTEKKHDDQNVLLIYTMTYKKLPGSVKYQIDIWQQEWSKTSQLWSTTLQHQSYVKAPDENIKWHIPEPKDASETTFISEGGQPKTGPVPGLPATPSTNDESHGAGLPQSQRDTEEDTEEDTGEESVNDDEGEEELEEMPLTPEQEEAKELYDEGQKLLTTGTLSSGRKAYRLLAGAAALNHTKSRELVAFSFLFGDYLTRNISRSLEMFEQLSIEGNPRGQLGLGIIHASGIQVNSSQAKALIYFTFSALGGDELAQMILGYRHLSGVGVQSSCETALIYYSKAARRVAEQVTVTGGPVVQRIRLYDEAEATTTSISNVLDDDLIQYYQFLADKGDTSAQVGLGQLYYQGGRGITVDYDLAFYYFLQASKGGDAMADAYVGRMYAEGVGNVEKDYETAYEYFYKSAEQENPIGQCGLGMLYLKGHHVAKDPAKAFYYFQKSSEKNWVDAHLQLGLMYFRGEGGVKLEPKLALKYFNLAAQGGNVLGLFNLAQMHAAGMGVMRSCHIAVELYKNVAERGPWSKLLMEGFDFYKQGYVDVAMLKYLVAAELGYEVAQSNVGYILDTGETDAYADNEKYRRALLQWTRAAGQGSTVARIKLGDYHYYGLGTDVDYEQAIQHYRVAGEQQSNAQAMYNLGYMHEAGLGLKQDLHLAKRFYDMAAEMSKEAYLPVTLALARLSFLSQIDAFSDASSVWNIVTSFHPQLYFGPSWDMYIITILGMAFGLIFMIRTRLILPRI
ncbi:protein sel-1 homolog 1-like [Watersipora subatra]|uniref:protein sel-1 homolog 1-like n=1 Tax=Watersipora subatra TaxID=2589382 RepID=UPI00355BBC3B